VTGYICWPHAGIGRKQRRTHFLQGTILSVCIGQLVSAFQFHTDTENIAVAATAVLRSSGVPGPVIKTDKLHYFPIAPNKQVCRDPHSTYLIKKGVLIPIQAILKKAFDAITTELPRR
jgi:hypothetical protein